MKMQKKVRKEELKKKAESIKELVNDILNEKIDLPDKALIVDFDATLNIFTKKRIELLEMINYYQPASIQELSNIVHRKKQAVNRDLQMLNEFDVIKLEKRGKFTFPIVKREIIVLNLKEQKPQKQIILNAEVYINKVNVNKMMEVSQ